MSILRAVGPTVVENGLIVGGDQASEIIELPQVSDVPKSKEEEWTEQQLQQEKQRRRRL